MARSKKRADVVALLESPLCALLAAECDLGAACRALRAEALVGRLSAAQAAVIKARTVNIDGADEVSS